MDTSLEKWGVEILKKTLKKIVITTYFEQVYHGY